MRIPDKGMPREALIEKLESFRGKDVDWRTGKVFGFFYDAGKEIEEIAKLAYMSYLSENALDPTVIPSPMFFENAVVDMCRHHLQGDEQVVGNFTSGGTESCMLAVKTARDYAKNVKGIDAPEMILPVTAHAAFHKGAHYFSVKTVMVDVNKKSFRAEAQSIAEAITPNTALIVASAASYAHGVVDHIEEIGRLAKEKGILFHVDGCIGGFLLPYFKRLGGDVPPFDFSVPGVTSISMDLHKYAFCPKPASVVLYKDKELRQHQIFACSGWTGYTIVNNTFQSSKSGGPVAASWAVMNHLGDEGYLKLADGLYRANLKLLEGLGKIPDLYVLGQPDMCLIGVASDTVNVFHVADEMKTLGWHIQPQLKLGDYKENFHLSINPANIEMIDGLLSDLRKCVETAKTMPASSLDDSIKQMIAGLDPATMDSATIQGMLGMVGMDGFNVPERMATINEILNALPPKVADKMLTIFLNEMFLPGDAV